MKSKIKKHILLLVAILLLTQAKAQQDTLKFETFKQFSDFVTQTFKQKYPSLTFLKHRLITPELNIFDYYKGKIDDSVCNALNYLSLVNELDIANFENDNKINLDYIEHRMNDYTQQNITPISLSLIEYCEFSDTAFDIDAIDFVNNQFVDNSPNGFYPFKTDTLFASSALNQVFTNSQVNFIFNDSLLLTNINSSSIENMYIDFDDGSGYVRLIKGSIYTINYGTIGTKQIKIKLSFNNTIYYSTSTINITSSTEGGTERAPSILPPDRITNVIAFDESGLPLFSKYGVWYAPCNITGHIRKPYIISVGANPGNGKQLIANSAPIWLNMLLNNTIVSIPNTPFGWNGDWRGTCYETYNGVYNKRFSPMVADGYGNGNQYLDRLRDEGYDIIILLYNNGTDFAKNNAALFKECIKEINAEKFANGFYFENIVSGYSAGGIATKLALAEMESDYKLHKGPHPHTKMWVSFETENQGCGVPLGVQNFIDFQANPGHVIPPLIPILNKADIINQIVAGLAFKFNNNPLAWELTTYNSAYPYGLSPQRSALLNRFASIPGNNSNGYPEFCRRVGVSNGSTTGIHVNHTTPEAIESKLAFQQGSYNATSFPPSSPCAQQYQVKVPHTAKITTARWWSSSNAGSYVFNGDVFSDNEITWFGMKCWKKWNGDCKCIGPYNIGSYLQIGHKTVMQPNNSDYDATPASRLSSQVELYESSAYKLYSSLGFDCSASDDPSLHAFAPTGSCLDLHNATPPYAEADYFTSPVSLGLMQINPVHQAPYRSYGYPYINHPSDHYKITPYDAVIAIGDETGTYPDGTAKPANQLHVEDPLYTIGEYLARVEVAPEDLFLSDRTIGSTVGAGDGYAAEFEARHDIIVGNGIYSKNGNQNYLTPDGDFTVNEQSFAKIHAGNEIAFLPGTKILQGAELEAFIEEYGCVNTIRSFTAAPNIENSNDNNTEPGNNYEKTTINKNEVSIVTNLKIYPNPSSGLIVVENNIEETNSKLLISDLTGKIIYENIINNNQPVELNLLHFENGIYLLQIINKNNSAHSKISIAK